MTHYHIGAPRAPASDKFTANITIGRHRQESVAAEGQNSTIGRCHKKCNAAEGRQDIAQ